MRLRPTIARSARQYPVAAGFFEARLPILSNLDVNLAGRYEKFYSDVTDKDNSVFVPAASLKWQIIDQVGFRTSWGETFSQVNPPRENPPITGTSATSAKYTGLGGTGQQYATFNFPNLDVEPQKGTYFDVGFLFDVGNFRANVDYYAINVDDYTRTMAVNNVLDALAVPIGNTSIVSTAVDINCSSGALTQPIAALGGRPLVELVGPCVQGVTKMSDLTGGRVNFFGGNRQTNSGELKTSGIDLSASYTFENFLGGEFVPSIDFSRVLEWELGDFVIGGVKVADGYDGLGFVNGSTGRIGQSGREVSCVARTVVSPWAALAEHHQSVRAGDHQRRSDAVRGQRHAQREHWRCKRRQRVLTDAWHNPLFGHRQRSGRRWHRRIW